MENVRRVGLIAVVAALLAWSPATSQAQQVGFAVDGFGGIALPTANLNKFQDFGPAFGLGVEYDISERVFVRGSGQVDLHSGADAADLEPPLGTGPDPLSPPDMTLFHYTAGLGFHLVPEDASAWNLTVSIEAGGTSVTTDDFPDGAVPPGQFVGEEEEPTMESDFSESYFNLSPGVRVGYEVNEQFSVFFRSQPHFAFADKDRTAAFAQFDKELPADGFEELWNLPLTAGVQIGF